MGRLLVTCVLIAVTCAGCGPQPASPTALPTATSTLATSTPTPAKDGTGESNDMTYRVTTTSIKGDSEDGRGTWRTTFGQLAAGDPAVVDSFNGASHAAVMDQVTVAMDGASDGTATWSFESTGTVTFRSIAVAQLIIGTLFYGAHPSTQVGTVVIDSRSTDPIMLASLFTDPQAGLDVLAEQSRELLAKDGLDVEAHAPPATAESFANWIPTDAGLEIHFQPYQFGSALPAVVTVPWPVITPLLTPDMAGLATG